MRSMSIQLRNIDKNNFERCIALTVDDKQEKYIAPNWWSLLEANYQEDRYPLAIYDGETMIGFLMYSFYLASKEYPIDSWWLERFMIDKRFQNSGYGEIALYSFMNMISKKIGNIEIRTTVEPENTIAIKFYEKFGFVKTGELVLDEIVLLKSK